MTKLTLPYHYLFLMAGGILGLLLVFTNPPFQSNDEDRHFFNAYSLAKGNWGPVLQDGSPGSLISASSRDVVLLFQNIKYDQSDKLTKERLNEIREQEDNETVVFYPHGTATILPFPYIPAAIGIKICEIFTMDPVMIGWCGRIGSLIAYLTIIFFAIRIIPFYKGLLTLSALTPMAIYQGSSITYDSTSFALLFLLFSLIIRFYFQEKPISPKQVLVFTLIALAQILSKDGYFILFFTLFAIPINRFEKKYIYFAAFLCILIISFAPSYLWNQILQKRGLTNEDFQFRTDYLFDPKTHLKYHLKDPLNLVIIIINNIFFEGKGWIIGSLGRFGFSYSFFPNWFYILHFTIIMTITCLDQANRTIKMYFRTVFAVITILGIGATITGYYIYQSPVGAETLFNFQGRYLTPFLPFILFGFFYIPHKKIDERFINWGTISYIIFLSFYFIKYITGRYYSG